MVHVVKCEHLDLNWTLHGFLTCTFYIFVFYYWCNVLIHKIFGPSYKTPRGCGYGAIKILIIMIVIVVVSVISIYSADRKDFHRIDIIEISCRLSPRYWRLPCAVLLENKNRRSLLLWEYEIIKPLQLSVKCSERYDRTEI